MMKDKKAWLRIIEAFMAILIVASVLIIVMLRNPSQLDRGDEIYEKQRFILKQVSLNDSLRGEILISKTNNTEKFIESLAPVSWNFTTRVCGFEEICEMLPSFNIEKEVYVDQILITSNLTYFNPRKFKFFVWMKN